MIIIADKFCFVHIPKTSGSSLTKMLTSYVSSKKKTRIGGRGWQGTWHFTTGNANGQHTAVCELNDSQIDAIKDMDVVTIARNPYTWLVSFYTNFVKIKFATFSDFIAHIQKHRNLGWGRKLLQAAYIDNSHGIDVKVYKFEDSPHKKICDEYGLTFEEVHDLQRGYSQSLREYYDNDILAIVNTVFRRDFEYLGYDMIHDMDDFNLEFN